jgi:hypothetical protein
LVATSVIRLEVIGAADDSGKEATTERTVRHKTNAETATYGKDLRLRIAGPQRVL